MNRDEKAEEKKPEVLKDKPQSKKPDGTRSFSTLASRRANVAMTTPQNTGVESQGHIFGLPELPIPPRSHLKHRYEPIVQQVTGLIMKHGKLGVAQRVRQSVPRLCFFSYYASRYYGPMADNMPCRIWQLY